MRMSVKDTNKRVNLILDLSKTYTGHYWATHPRSAEAIRILTQGEVTKIDLSKAERAVSGALKEWKRMNEVYSIGSACLLEVKSKNLAKALQVEVESDVSALIMSKPRVDRGGLMIDIFANGKLISVYTSIIKRKKYENIT